MIELLLAVDLGFVNFIISYMLSSLGFFAVSCAIVKPQRQQLLQVFSASIIFGPFLLALMLYHELMWLPGHEGVVYILITSFLLLATLVVFRLHPNYITDLAREIRDKVRSFSKLDRLLLGLLALVLLSLFALAISLPLYGHDIAEHSKSAAIIAQAKDFSVYPLHGYKGVFTQAKHPPTVIGLWVWQYFFYLRDSYDQTLLGKLISPSVALLTCLALIGFAEKRRQTLAILGSIVLLCTPLMYTNVASSHVDINRGATYLGAALWLLLCLRSPSWPLAIMTGLAIGLAARVHLSSLVIGPLLATSYLAIAVFRKGFKWSALKSDVAICSLMALAALAVCGFDYVRMLYIYGKNVVSTEEGFSVVANSGINYRAYVEIVRNIHGIPQKIFNGLLKGFTDIELMGLTYWLALVGVLVLAIRRRFDTQLAVFMLQFLFFLILLALAVLFSFDLLLKNSRYYLMFQPFVAVLACAALEPLYEKNTEI